MADWKNAQDYEYPKNFSRDDWAWEFLKRNPSYAADYESAKKGGVLYSPARQEGESRNQWLHRTGDDGFSAIATVFYARKWGIIGVIQDPSAKSAPPFVHEYPHANHLYDSLGRYFEASDEANGEVVVKPGFAAIIFNLKSPLSEQVKEAGKLLAKLQASIDWKGTNVSKAYPLYLRLLDAKSSGAKTPEILKKVSKYKIYKNTADYGYEASKRLTYDLSKAKNLRDNPLSILS